MDYETPTLTARDKYIGRAPKKPAVKKIAVQDDRAAARKLLKTSLGVHRRAIKQLKRDIKRHKLLKKQARLVYKITK